MDWLTTLGMAMGSAWLSGINLSATVVTLGVLQRFHLVTLPGDLGIVGEWWVIGVAGFLYIVEFIADKIPAVDSAWDAIHTFIRIPAGAVLAATAFADFDPAVRLIALLVGGGVALSSHGTKAATRLAANTSPEPISNITLSIAEDIFAIGSTVLMVFFPVVILVVVAIFVIVVIWLAPRILRAIRRLFNRARHLFGSNPAASQLLLIMALLCLGGGNNVIAQTKGPPSARAAIQSFFENLKTQRYDALYEYLPTQVQKQITREQLAFSLKRLDSILQIEKMEVGRVQQRGDFAVIDTVLYGRLKRPLKIDGQDADEGRVAVQQLLLKESEQWKVITADDRTRRIFQQSTPEFERGFQFKPPRFEFKQNGAWRPFNPAAMGR
jgi:hypothetical protein